MSSLPIAAIAPTFETVPFHGAIILAARDRDGVRIPMKPFCDTIGLPWEPQRKRIMRDEMLSEGSSIMEVPTAGGVQRHLTLPLNMITGFLFGQEARRYAPELRERVKLFRRECFDILHAHFFPPAPVAPPPAALPMSAEIAREGTRLMLAIKRETNPKIRRYYHGMLTRLSDAAGVEVPALEEIGADALTPTELVEPFFRGLETLTTMGYLWNHSGEPGKIAFSLPEVLDGFRQLNIPMPGLGEMAGALKAHGPAIDATRPMISNMTRKPMLCWVFEDRADG